MANKKENRRAQFTRKALMTALIELLQQYPLDRISVTQLCRQADINRSTFYLHYTDVYDLMDRTEDAIVDYFREQFLAHHQSTEPNDFAFVRIYQLELLRDHINIAQKLFHPMNGSKLFERILGLSYALFRQDWGPKLPHLNEEQLQLLHHYITAGSSAVISEWIRTGAKTPTDRIRDLITQLSRACLHEAALQQKAAASD